MSATYISGSGCHLVSGMVMIALVLVMREMIALVLIMKVMINI
jgi:hypothetical protein